MLIPAMIYLMFFQASAPSSLVYLECQTIDPNGIQKDWQITLNEAQGTVDYNSAISGPQRRPARFTGTTVHFIDFTLSRIDLSISRPVTGGFGAKQGIERGQCRISRPQSRAF